MAMRREVDYELADLLRLIEVNETNYGAREALVYQALALAKRAGYTCGIRFDTTPDEKDKDAAPWPVVCIMLPEHGEVRPFHLSLIRRRLGLVALPALRNRLHTV